MYGLVSYGIDGLFRDVDIDEIPTAEHFKVDLSITVKGD
jgi:hypothetical protein